MGTTADKLNKLKATKEAIRTAINNKGGTLTTSDKFSDYATAIDNIQSGSTNESITITQNGTYTAPDGVGYSPITVNIPQTAESGTVKNLLDTTKSCSNFFNDFNGTSIDGLISYNDTANVTSMTQMFNWCTKLTTIPRLNTSNVTSMFQMFYYCSSLTTIPLLDTSKVTAMNAMFQGCSKLTTIPQLDTSSCTNMNNMFLYCDKLTTIPQLNTSKVTIMYGMFQECPSLTTILQLDMSSATNTGSMFYDCQKLTYLKLLNVKTSLQIGSATTYGHLIEKDCLIQIISELIKPSSETRTLTMGTANKAKIADTYVKLLADDGTGKYPFEVCASTDEGAMTIEAYCNSKNWTLA